MTISQRNPKELGRRAGRGAAPAGLDGCLTALDAAADAADALGLDTTAARATADQARQRLGFTAATFVLALAGGTGSGKSSLLNALAGRQVSPTGPVRPVTDQPLAWAPADRTAALTPLLDWLGVTRVVTHHDPRLAGLCLVDLPDYDSVEPGHRASVDALLPRLDAVCWVLDPDKYNDHVLHQAYLRPLAHHADRLVFALNRCDLLRSSDAVGAVTADVRRTLAADGITGRPVFAVSAAPADGHGTGELEELRGWLADRVDAKAIVVAKLAADCAAAGAELGRAAGLDPAARDRGSPLVAERAWSSARDRAASAARAAVDVPGVQSACVRRTRAEARATGAGPLGRVLGFVASRRGRPTNPDRSLDPVGYARDWRARTTLARVVNPIRELTRQAAATAAPALRPAIMQPVGGNRLDGRVSDAVDDAVTHATLEHARVPRWPLWPLLGVLQAAAAAAVLLGLLWIGTLYLAGEARADLPELPAVLGIPLPVALVGGGLVCGLILGRLLEATAVLAGRRWARRLTRQLDQRVATEVQQAAQEPLAALQSARDQLASHLADLDHAASQPQERRAGRR